MAIDFRMLRYLRVIAECGTYREAAERLNVTQPALSKNILLLERQLGVKVLTRGRHGALPTIFGERLIAKSRTFDNELTNVLQEIEDLKENRAGRVSIGSVPPLTNRLMPKVVELMKKTYPEVLVRLKEQSSKHLTEALLAGDYDFVVGGFGFEQALPNVEEEFLFSSPTMAFVGREHPLADRDKTSLKELNDYPWIGPEHSGPASIALVSLMHSANPGRSEPSIETDSVPTMRALLKDGKHFVLNTPEFFADGISGGEIAALRLTDKATLWRFALKRRSETFETPAMCMFAECLRRMIRDDDKAPHRLFTP